MGPYKMLGQVGGDDVRRDIGGSRVTRYRTRFCSQEKWWAKLLDSATYINLLDPGVLFYFATQLLRLLDTSTEITRIYYFTLCFVLFYAFLFSPTRNSILRYSTTPRFSNVVDFLFFTTV